MKMKICSLCGEDLPMYRFCKNRTKKIGYNSRCKDCEYRGDTIIKRCPTCDMPRLLSDFHGSNPRTNELQNECRWCYEKTRSREKAAKKAAKKRWRKKMSPGLKAKRSQARAIRSGKIKQPICCEKCELVAETKPYCRNYNKPLEIQWLCGGCHSFARAVAETNKLFSA